ncbi:MAG: hypothetical protein OEW89_01475 [Gammaproteobacteria bacterium]|nr:hypothetical protein [Gammaproteobacteria bacterium]
MSINAITVNPQRNITTQVAEIIKLSESVRCHINTHRYQSVLLDDSKIWNQICSSLDLIGDSLCAVESYETTPFPEDIGLKYIYTYGILQALFLMQDALRHLSEAFEVPYELTETLREIRNYRNASIGHPSKQDQNKKRYYNYISRISMNKPGFDLMRSSGDRDHIFTRVDIARACSDQLDGIIDAYRKIVERLEEIDKMHKEKYKDTPLADIFHSAMGYFFEKIAQGIHAHSYGDREFGYSHVRLVKDTYKKFQAALVERNELNDYTEYDLKEYFHALDRLDTYFSGTENTMEESDARIYLSYLRYEHKHFLQIANEIDAEYQNKT